MCAGAAGVREEYRPTDLLTHTDTDFTPADLTHDHTDCCSYSYPHSDPYCADETAQLSAFLLPIGDSQSGTDCPDGRTELCTHSDPDHRAVDSPLRDSLARTVSWTLSVSLLASIGPVKIS